MRTIFLLGLSVALVCAQANGGRAEYMGGTLASVESRTDGRVFTTSEERLNFKTKSTAIEVPYDRINVLEYGQKVDRRLLPAVLISPLLLMSKSRKHFLTIGFEDENGKQQAMVFRIEKSDVRSLLVSLEARTGRKIQFQDEEARKAGKG